MGKQFFIQRELKNRTNKWLITLPWVHYYPAEPTPQRPRHWNISRGISFAQASASIKKHSHKLGKPLNGFRMGFFTMLQEWFIVPRGNARVWFTRKVTEYAFPSPSHFVVNPQGFINTPVLVVLLPPRGVLTELLRFEVRGGGILLPLLVDR